MGQTNQENIQDWCESGTLPDGYRVIRHPQHEGLRGEYELQYANQDGDFQNLKFSHDQDELIALANK